MIGTTRCYYRIDLNIDVHCLRTKGDEQSMFFFYGEKAFHSDTKR